MNLRIFLMNIFLIMTSASIMSMENRVTNPERVAIATPATNRNLPTHNQDGTKIPVAEKTLFADKARQTLSSINGGVRDFRIVTLFSGVKPLVDPSAPYSSTPQRMAKKMDSPAPQPETIDLSNLQNDNQFAELPSFEAAIASLPDNYEQKRIALQEQNSPAGADLVTISLNEPENNKISEQDSRTAIQKLSGQVAAFFKPMTDLLPNFTMPKLATLQQFLTSLPRRIMQSLGFTGSAINDPQLQQEVKELTTEEQEAAGQINTAQKNGTLNQSTLARIIGNLQRKETNTVGNLQSRYDDLTQPKGRIRFNDDGQRVFERRTADRLTWNNGNIQREQDTNVSISTYLIETDPTTGTIFYEDDYKVKVLISEHNCNLQEFSQPTDNNIFFADENFDDLLNI